MMISTLRRWHWLAISLAIGLVHGSIWEMSRSATTDPLDDYEKIVTDSHEFEQALVTNINGHRRFEDVVVRPYHGVHGERAFLVTGQYWDGTFEWRDSRQVAVWSPACYVAAMPYTALSAPAAPDPQTRIYPSIMDYLSAMHASAGVSYRYARFWWAGEPLFLSLTFSVLLIGIIWPTLVNLLTFGSIFRPREERGISLWKVRSKSTPAPAPPTRLSVAPSLGEIEAELQAMPRDRAMVVESQPPVAALCGKPMETPTIIPAAPAKEFGAEKEDFYPTELHAP